MGTGAGRPAQSALATIVLVADAQAMFAEALAQGLEHEGLRVAPEYPHRGGMGLDAVRRHRPDVVVYDHWMPELDGPAATEAIATEAPGTKVLITSWCHGPQHIREALAAGAVGFLPKGLRVTQVAHAVRRAGAGEPLVYADQLARLVDDLEGRLDDSYQHYTGLSSLTEREVEVLQALADGTTLAELAAEHSVSVGTVKNHVHKILTKTGTRSQVEAVALARKELFLGPGRQRRRAGPAATSSSTRRRAPATAATPAATAAPTATTGPTGPATRGRRARDGRVSVLVADTQRLFADAVAGALAHDARLRVLPALPARAGEAIDAAVQLRPDVVVYDLYLPDMEAAAALRALSRWAPGTRALIASWYHGRRQVRRALAIGAGVVIPKSATTAALGDAVYRAGGRHAADHAALVDAVVAALDDGRPVDERLLELLPRELQVLHLLAGGRTPSQISGQLCLAVGTVKNLISSLMAKLGVRTRLQALTIAREHGFVA